MKLSIFVGLVFVLTLSIVGSALAYENVVECNSLVDQGRYIDAGLCYEDMKVWDNCTYYLLKGAREAEKEWNFNKGDWNGRVIALEYYGGAHTKACIQNYGDYALLDKIDQYHEWLVYWLTSHADPPFDMDALLNGLHERIWPQNTEQPSGEQVNIPQTSGGQLTNNSKSNGGGSSQPTPETVSIDPVLLGVGALVIIAILGVIGYAVTRKPSKPAEPYLKENARKKKKGKK